MRYLSTLERAGHNLSAYVPDLPGCVATGKTREEVVANMKGAIAMHLRGMIEDSDLIPQPNSDPEFVDVALPAPA